MIIGSFRLLFSVCNAVVPRCSLLVFTVGMYIPPVVTGVIPNTPYPEVTPLSP